MPRLWKYGILVNRRQKTAAATVRPEPMITCAVLRYMTKYAAGRSMPACRASW